jgi:ribosome maturation factor RimP
MKESAALQALLATEIAALGYEFWGCLDMSGRQQRTLRVYIDSVEGIKLADCERVSRQLSAVLDVEDPIAGNYTLEVSSPGLDRPLFTLAHYQRFIKSRVSLRLHTAIDGQKHFRGLLLDVVGENIMINTEDKTTAIAWTNIAKANVLLEIINDVRGKRP